MSKMIHYLNDGILCPFVQIGNALPKKETKKLSWLLAFFMLLAAVALNSWPARMEPWTFGIDLRIIAEDAFGSGIGSWNQFTVPMPEISPITPLKVAEVYGKLPLSFEVNEGQTDSQVKFLSHGLGYSLFLTPTEAVLALRKPKNAEAQLLQQHLAKVKNRRSVSAEQAQTVPEAPPVAVHVKLVGANLDPEIMGLNEFPGKVNYLSGNDPKHWHTNIPTYGKVKYAQVYPGIDLVYYGNFQQLEHDFVIAPGANPSRIAMEISGAGKASINAKGDLVLATQGGEIRFCKPMIYQEINGLRQEIAGSYVLTAEQRVGFQVSAYDATQPLVIDPILVYSTYLGGSNSDYGQDIAVDPAGNAYATGSTDSSGFPGAFSSSIQSNPGGGADAFVVKINARGTALVYSTYLGGNSDDVGWSIAVDPAGNAYVTGGTTSSDFPGASSSPIQPHFGGYGDTFVAKLNAAGSALVYSTYLGGSGFDFDTIVGGGIAVDPAGNAYVIGSTDSSDFPGAFNSPIQSSFGGGNYDIFVTKINAGGTALVYSTYLGGSGYDVGWDIAVDPAGNAYVTGSTDSVNFPGTSGSPIQSSFSGGTDAFVAKINARGTALVYSTYLGGSSYDFSPGIAVDPAGNAYATGNTDSSDFPGASSSLLQPSLHGNMDAFVAKINACGTALVYSTYLGGNSADVGRGIAVDPAGNAYVTGNTDSSDFPGASSSPIQSNPGGGTDAFVTKLNAGGTALVYSTYLGGNGNDIGMGIAVDPAGNAYVTGNTDSVNFPSASSSSIQSNFGGGYEDVFIAKIRRWPGGLHRSKAKLNTVVPNP